jgi:erythromycin esterase-like protein
MNKRQLEALERERYDISYRKIKPKKKLIIDSVEPTKIEALSERYKQMFFHAGRYSAGARDAKALKEYASYLAFEELSQDSTT